MDTLNDIITRGITNSLQEDITIISDIYEHPEFSTENDLEGIIFDYGNKIQAIRELTRRLDILVHDYDVYLKDELTYKLKTFREKREKFIQSKRKSASVYGRSINADDDFNINAPNFSQHDIDDDFNVNAPNFSQHDIDDDFNVNAPNFSQHDIDDGK